MNNRIEKTLSNHVLSIDAHVVWADGMADSERMCTICGTQTCIKPTHTDRYKTVSDTLAKKWDKDNPVI